jgi:hypothetical protein
MNRHAAENTLPLSVDDVGFLLDRLGEDCHPLQFLRELTQNSIEAILRTPEKRGEVIWDVDWTEYDLNGVYKLSITDTGCGMTGEDMCRYINQLSSSTRLSRDGNYGVGAKIAAATRNHAGLIYLSWVDSKGAMIHLWRNPESRQYGLRQIERPDGTYGHWAGLDDDVKPDAIGRHGTKIVLYGNSASADTMAAPPEAASPSIWIAKYLNTRYFRFPEGVTIKARQGWQQPRTNRDVNLLRTLIGQAAYLKQHEACSGIVEIDGARVHWWILREESALSENSGWIESSGHIAAIHRDELYEMNSGRAGSARLQQFGVIFGHRQVVLYVEPLPKPDVRLTTNTARTHLILGGSPLPWTDWAAEFRSKMPEAISAHMEEIASRATDRDHSKPIRDRLKALLDLFKLSRYRPAPSGRDLVGDPLVATASRATRSDGEASRGNAGTPRTSPGPAPGGVYSVFLKSDGTPGQQVKADVFPDTKWISVSDGTRDPGDMEDRAARFLEEQNLLLINADFRVFTDMTKHWVEAYTKEQGRMPGLEDLVRESVRSWYEQALTETIIGLQALRGSREWTAEDIRSAWSEQGLTSVVMQRYHPYNSIKRELGTKVAPLKK